MRRVKFVAQGSNSAFGSFSAGDVRLFGDALAHHLVTEARVAKYVDDAAAPAASPAEPAKRARKAK